MKQFIFARLHARNHGYDYYVPPHYAIGGIKRLIASDLLDGRTRFLFLENRNGQVTFGVREQLALRDALGRPICHFTGFQLDPHEGIPSFAAVARVIAAITAEANAVHAILDQDPNCGKKLQTPTIKFAPDSRQAGNDWDDQVRNIQRRPEFDVLVMFDEHGQQLPIPARLIYAVPVSSGVSTVQAYGGSAGSFAREVEGGRGGKVGSDFSGSTGIKSGAKLPAQQTYVPPLEPSPSEMQHHSCLDALWNFFKRTPKPNRDSKHSGHDRDY